MQGMTICLSSLCYGRMEQHESSYQLKLIVQEASAGLVNLIRQVNMPVSVSTISIICSGRAKSPSTLHVLSCNKDDRIIDKLTISLNRPVVKPKLVTTERS
jgi:beta-glucosidase/6-phospho-beta-glucosidase/beta-galactosidase